MAYWVVGKEIMLSTNPEIFIPSSFQERSAHTILDEWAEICAAPKVRASHTVVSYLKRELRQDYQSTPPPQEMCTRSVDRRKSYPVNEII